MKTYERFSGEELEIAELIQQRRLQLLVHSCIYYNMDRNLILDLTWDKWAKELVELQRKYPHISCEVDWYDAFKDWDASTGAFLPLTDEWVVRKATQLAGVKKSTPAPKKEVVKKSSDMKRALF
jgi:hypothetical protein